MKRIFILWVGLLALNSSLLLAQESTSIDSLSVTAKNPQSGSTSIYTLKFSLNDPLQADAVLELTFSAEFDLSHVLLAGSNTINGGFKTEIENNVLRLTRKGQGDVMPGGEIYEISFANIRNPSTGDYQVNITLINGASGGGSISQKSANVGIVPAAGL